MMVSSCLKSGLALGVGLGLKLYFASFRGLCPITVGCDVGTFHGWGDVYIDLRPRR